MTIYAMTIYAMTIQVITIQVEFFLGALPIADSDPSAHPSFRTTDPSLPADRRPSVVAGRADGAALRLVRGRQLVLDNHTLQHVDGVRLNRATGNPPDTPRYRQPP